MSCCDEMLVAFSCRRRGICPSCTTGYFTCRVPRRNLLDRVLPHVPMRQWVLSLPRWARFLVARDPLLITRALESNPEHLTVLGQREHGCAMIPPPLSECPPT